MTKNSWAGIVNHAANQYLKDTAAAMPVSIPPHFCKHGGLLRCSICGMVHGFLNQSSLINFVVDHKHDVQFSHRDVLRQLWGHDLDWENMDLAAAEERLVRKELPHQPFFASTCSPAPAFAVVPPSYILHGTTY